VLVLDLTGLLHEQTYHGLTFVIPSPDYYATKDSCGAEVTFVTHGSLKVGSVFR